MNRSGRLPVAYQRGLGHPSIPSASVGIGMSIGARIHMHMWGTCTPTLETPLESASPSRASLAIPLPRPPTELYASAHAPLPKQMPLCPPAYACVRLMPLCHGH